MDSLGQLANIPAYDRWRHHIHVQKMGLGKFIFRATLSKSSDKNTCERMALQYGSLRDPNEEIKRNYTVTVSFTYFI